MDSGFFLQVDDAVLVHEYDSILSLGGSVSDYRRWAQVRIDALKHALEGIPEDRVRYHICWGSWHGPHGYHWMWFIFPQLRGLGFSDMSRKFAISSLDEARAYLKHPVLGPCLVECTTLVNQVQGRSAAEIFGYPDDLKFCSSMTLFALADPDNPIFKDVIRKYFWGEFDPLTSDRLNGRL